MTYLEYMDFIFGSMSPVMADGCRQKAVFVTGGGSGIGRVNCLALTRADARVAVSDVDLEGAEETVRLMDGIGGRAVSLLYPATWLRVSSPTTDMVSRLWSGMTGEKRVDCSKVKAPAP